MHTRMLVSATLLLWVLTAAAAAIAQDDQDEIFKACKDHPRGPWCYQETVEQLNQPELCEKILKYWPKADGVHGWCYYQLAMKNKDCRLCDRIHTADIKRMCRRDVCK
jgi:hypothetical protein